MPDKVTLLTVIFFFVLFISPFISGQVLEAKPQDMYSSGASRLQLSREPAGVLFSPSAASRQSMSEGGLSLNYSISLGSKPTAEVSLLFNVHDSSEVTIDKQLITISPDQWDQPHILTVTAVDDEIVDGNINHTIEVTYSSNDPYYDGFNSTDILLTTIDNDSAALVFTYDMPLQVSEASPTLAETYAMSLSSRPPGPVTINISDPSGQVSLMPSSLVYTEDNYHVAQQVFIRAVDDDQVEGLPMAVQITHLATAALENPYNNTSDTSSVVVDVADNDTNGYIVSPTNLPVIEGTPPQWFTVALTAEPSGTITIGLADTSTGELNLLDSTLSPITQFSLTPSNWQQGFSIGISAADDATIEGTENFSLSFSFISSTDPSYTSAPAGTIGVTVDDAGAQAILVSAGNQPELKLSEGGSTGSYEVSLSTDPASTVTVDLSCDASQLQFDLPGGGIDWISSGSLSFDSGNWATPQTIIVRAIDDAIVENDEIVNITHTVSGGGWAAATQAIRLSDNDDPAILLAPGSDLVVTESGGVSAFTIRLASQPTSNVQIFIAATEAASGNEAGLLYENFGHLALPAFIFDESNWNIPQVVFLKGLDDDFDDGNQYFPVNITASQAGGLQEYNNILIHPMMSSCIDDETTTMRLQTTPTNNLKEIDAASFNYGDAVIAGFSLSTVPYDPATGTAGSADFTVFIGPQLEVEWPTDSDNWISAPSTITIAMATGNTRFAPGGAALPWNEVQFRVRARDDDTAEGFHQDKLIISASSQDPSYTALPAQVMNFDITDNNSDGTDGGDDIAGVSTVQAGNIISESGNSTSFDIQLDTQPVDTVQVAFSLSPADEAQVSPASLQIEPAGWMNPATVTITGKDDFIQDGDQLVSVQVNVASSDLAYNSVAVTPLTFTNLDDDSRGIAVSPISGPTSEEGQAASFTIRLLSRPTSDVTIPLSSSDSSEGTVSPAAVTCTPDNWNSPQLVTVNGVDDNLRDGDIMYSILTAPAVSSDPLYNSLNAEDVAVMNLDDTKNKEFPWLLFIHLVGREKEEPLE